ncbi:hypothetical protein V1224_14925 [Lachnospiraceae bacterium JLR.KK008]
MNRNIIKQYIMNVYDDGNIELVPYKSSKEENKNVIELSAISSRIAQVLTVIHLTIRFQEGESPVYIGENITRAVKTVASKFEVTFPAVQDKCTRQLSDEKGQLSASRFKYYVSEYIKKGDNGLEHILLKNVSDKLSLQDRKAIEKFFANPSGIKLVLNHVEV